MHSFTRGLRAGFVAAAWLGWIAGAAAQAPTPGPTPQFDVQDSPLTAEELAKELGYRFYGYTWKFSAPTFVRVRAWSKNGSAAEVPLQPPSDARWTVLYGPDKPQRQVTVHVLKKNDKKPLDGENGHLKDIAIKLEISVDGQEAPENAPPGSFFKQTTSSMGLGWTFNADLSQGPYQSLQEEWRFASGNLGIAFKALADASAEAAAHPGRSGQQEAAETSMREYNEAGLLAEPLNIFYCNDEIRTQPKQERQNYRGLSHDVPEERAVWLVTLECSHEPFKTNAPPTPTLAPTADEH